MEASLSRNFSMHIKSREVPRELHFSISALTINTSSLSTQSPPDSLHLNFPIHTQTYLHTHTHTHISHAHFNLYIQTNYTQTLTFSLLNTHIPTYSHIHITYSQHSHSHTLIFTSPYL